MPRDNSPRTTDLDLSPQTPSDRSVVPDEESKKLLEDYALGVRRGKTEAKVGGKTLVGSPLNVAQATFLLVAASLLITVVAWAIGVPAITALAVGLSATAFFYLLAKITCPRAKGK
jgi:hypothetical protein